MWRFRFNREWSGAAIMVALLSSQVFGQTIDYVKQVKPILSAKCFACHGALKQEAGLRLDAAGLIRKGSEGGPIIQPNKPDESVMLQRVTSSDVETRMPPAGEGEPLDDGQLAILRSWIQQGADAPDEPVPADPRSHWAYQPPQKSQVPDVDRQPWMRNEIDALVAAVHQSHGITAVGSSPKGVLLRRLYLDLIGLPPTRVELHAFLENDSTHAVEELVDDLLKRPAHGERWARHWMDVWRYSDAAGFGNELRYSQKNVWRWRDWIIESINADKGYDQMVMEMLAGDELHPEDPNVLRATGFLARNWYKFDRNVWMDDTVEHTAKSFLGITLNCCRCHDHKYDPITQREHYAFRAVFEPYDVRTERMAGHLDIAQGGLVRAHDARPAEVTYLFERGDPKRPVKDEPVVPGVPSVIGGLEFQVEEIAVPVLGYYPDLRDGVTRTLTEQAEAAVAAANAALAEAKKSVAAADEAVLESKLAIGGAPKPIPGLSDAPEGITTPPTAEALLKLARAKLVVTEKKLATAQAQLGATTARIAAERKKYGLPTDAAGELKELALVAGAAERKAAVAVAEESLASAEHELLAATLTPDKDTAKAKKATEAARTKIDAAKKTLETARKNAEQASESYTALGTMYGKTSTGRRLALARWIADRRNPLTARVAVNHVWTRHFGTPLVDHVDDFGLRSPKPPHAALLDYLAVFLMENNWSLKKLHRLIVTSGVYSLSSSARNAAPQNSKVDPDNRLFWRATSRRMEAEVIRDSILAASGSLDLTVGGPEIDRKQGESSSRRSIYFQHARQRQMKFLEMFDAANPRECYQRKQSVRPQQAFTLMNSSLTLAESRLLARKIQTPNADEFIRDAFETVLSRGPNAQEVDACREFITRQTDSLSDASGLTALGTVTNRVPASADPALRARENLVLVLFNHNDFVTIR